MQADGVPPAGFTLKVIALETVAGEAAESVTLKLTVKTPVAAGVPLIVQVLLDPFEEQLYVPAALVQLGDGEGGQREIVGEQAQAEIVLGI